MKKISGKMRKVWPYVLAGILLFFVMYVGILSRGLWRIADGIFQQAESGAQRVGHVMKRARFGGESDFAALLPRLLGFDAPRTYLILFQNNTELRPSGGFIGVYAVVRMHQGKMTLLTLEGSEILDWQTPEEWRPEPPEPLKKHLEVDRWYFRDSNWSPDFPTAARQALTLYRGEGGTYAEEIDVVIGVTPAVFERILELTGPITVQGITFSHDNAVETLEYEVEYGYKRSNKTISERKDIIEPLMHAVLKKSAVDAFFHPEKYVHVVQSAFEEKHIVALSFDEALQSQFDAAGWTGRMTTSSGDYLQWVDANLGALKTDHAIQRDLLYYLSPNHNNGALSAMAEMAYTHTGTFDWRTTRYLSYVRIFVPSGSRITGFESTGGKKQEKIVRDQVEIIDQGEEHGLQWFGRFISVEPGETVRVRFYYDLPQRLENAVSEEKQYHLLVQKQSGTEAHGLTLNLNFDTTITAAETAESREQWENAQYMQETDLRVDREFLVLF